MNNYRNIYTLINSTVNKYPNNIAIIDGEEKTTYRDLNIKSNFLSRYINSQGFGPEDVVGVMIGPSSDAILAFLSVLKSGAVFLPLDTSLPIERLNYIQRDANVKLIITNRKKKCIFQNEGIKTILIDEIPKYIYDNSFTNQFINDKNLAYIIYTSGSTGKPKGVMVSHEALITFSKNAAKHYRIMPQERIAQFFNHSFDGYMDEIFPTLISGGSLVIYKGDKDFPSFINFCNQNEVNLITLPTGYWHELNNYVSKFNINLPGQLRLIIVGGERLSFNHVKRWNAKFGNHPQLFNTYGPSETTVEVTLCDVWEYFKKTKTNTNTNTIPIGEGISQDMVYILDNNLNKVNVEDIGHIYIGGSQLARGYLNSPRLTAENFIPNPFAKIPGERMYKSGDLGKLLKNGQIEYIEREDSQYKIDGYRIELKEIEETIMENKYIKNCIVSIRTINEGNNNKIIEAYITTDNSNIIPYLYKELEKKLPNYMIPKKIIKLEKIPLTNNGKIDFSRLQTSSYNSDSVLLNQQNKNHREINSILTEILGVNNINSEENLFALGLNSLKILQLISNIKQKFNKKLNFNDILNCKSIKNLLILLEQGKKDEISNLPVICRVSRNKNLPLSTSQGMIWFMNKLNQNNLAYNTQVCIEFIGSLNYSFLLKSFNQIIKRHEMLRTTIREEMGEPYLHIHDNFNVEIPLIDLSDLHYEKKEEVFKKIKQKEIEYKFDTSVLPLVRWKLLKLEEKKHMLIQVEHHFVHDGWSLAVLLREFTMFYNSYLDNKEAKLEPLKFQFADYSYWQHSLIKEGRFDKQLDYWKSILIDEPNFEIPFDKPRPKVNRFNGDAFFVRLDKETLSRVRKFSQEHNVTTYMTLLTVFKLLLYFKTLAEDIVIGSSVANRTNENENLIGMIVNPIVLRTRVNSNSGFINYLECVKNTLINAIDNKEVPFEYVVRSTLKKRHINKNPFFQVNFAFHDAEMPEILLGNLIGKVHYLHNGSSKFDLNVTGIPNESEEEILLEWEYNSDLFYQDTIKNLILQYKELLSHILMSPYKSINKYGLDLGLITED